jgi:hypothetical protein
MFLHIAKLATDGHGLSSELRRKACFKRRPDFLQRESEGKKASNPSVRED